MRDALAAAQSWAGVRPTALMSTAVPTTGDWSEADRLLAIAWSLDRAAICPGCGQYLDESLEHDGSMYKAERSVCGGCEAGEQDIADHKGEAPVAGEKVWISPDF